MSFACFFLTKGSLFILCFLCVLGAVFQCCCLGLGPFLKDELCASLALRVKSLLTTLVFLFIFEIS